jgi:hypothetical protein
VEDEKIQEIKQNVKEEKSPSFQRMNTECCGTKEEYVCLTSRS